MVADISPCPFCASPKVHVASCETASSVMCLACGGIGPGGDSVGEAVALWNCRSTLAASFGGRAPCEPPAAAERTDAPAAAEFVDGPRS